MKETKEKFAASSDMPVLFLRWREILRNDKGLSAQQMQAHEGHIFSCLKYLKACRHVATAAGVLDYLKSLPEDETQRNHARAALRWFFRSAAQQVSDNAAQPCHDPNPPLSSARSESMHASFMPWEQRMVAVLRTRHMQWRTEECSMGRARRFERWCVANLRKTPAAVISATIWKIWRWRARLPQAPSGTTMIYTHVLNRGGAGGAQPAG